MIITSKRGLGIMDHQMATHQRWPDSLACLNIWSYLLYYIFAVARLPGSREAHAAMSSVGMMYLSLKLFSSSCARTVMLPKLHIRISTLQPRNQTRTSTQWNASQILLSLLSYCGNFGRRPRHRYRCVPQRHYLRSLSCLATLRISSAARANTIVFSGRL